MTNSSRWPRAVLHLDMDAFYVNVYLLQHPSDRGVPLVVGGLPQERGVVSSASYEARKWGIRSAMPTSQAVRLCPALKIVPADWQAIWQSSQQIMTLLATYGPTEQVSVDEAYVDLTERPNPPDLAAQIRAEVKKQTGLPASVGLATSKLVAKVASDYDKPEGFTVVPPDTEAAFLAPLPARVIWGIGQKTAERLAAVGIHTCGQLAQADPASVKPIFGRQTSDVLQRAQGVDPRPVQAERGPSKSISQEWTFNSDVNDAGFLSHKLREMCEAVARSLQAEKLVARTVYVKFRWPDFTTFTRQRSVEVGIDGAEEIYRLALVIWQEHWPPGQRMRLLGVGVTYLQAVVSRQLGLGL